MNSIEKWDILSEWLSDQLKRKTISVKEVLSKMFDIDQEED